MDIELTKKIAAIVVRNRDQATGGGGAPIFITETEKEQQHVAFLIGRIIDGMVHDLENGVLIVVKH